MKRKAMELAVKYEWNATTARKMEEADSVIKYALVRWCRARSAVRSGRTHRKY